MPNNQVLLEMQNSLASVTLGAVFIANDLFGGNLFARFPDTYKHIEYLPSFLWGAIYLGAGLTHLVALRLEARSLRKQILWIKSGLWFVIGLSAINGDIY